MWQRDWNAPVASALNRSKDTLAGCVVLAAEIEWKNNLPHPVKPRLDYAALRSFGKPVGLAMRIAPHSGPFAENDTTAKFLCDTARALIADAKTNQLTPAEFQCDFDCAQKKLSGYAQWVRALRRAVEPLPLVITTLPSWLGEPEFPKLVREASSYVLQVHSVSSPLGDAHTMICDPALARKWVARAEKLALPFEIALPTYRSVVGYSPAGKLLGTISDGTRPAWPPGTLVREDDYKQARTFFLPERQTRLDDYTASLAKGTNEKAPKKERARALFHAACIARFLGLEIMGTEAGLDNAADGGSSYGSTDLAMVRLTGKPHAIEDEARDADPSKTIKFALPVSAQEKKRLATTKLNPELRYHYRHVAAGLAWKAEEESKKREGSCGEVSDA